MGGLLSGDRRRHWGCLWHVDGLRTQQITGELRQLGGTITVALDCMELRELICRETDPSDRRISRVWLTD
ncbi:MAG: winged helix-turn-helix transcriptional regulator, partial [Verrucomicrobia bacterium]|nr:winged helix-turn-helix transcriptional regulator [Verrucomicrobiota bacterium]